MSFFFPLQNHAKSVDLIATILNDPGCVQLSKLAIDDIVENVRIAIYFIVPL